MSKSPEENIPDKTDANGSENPRSDQNNTDEPNECIAVPPTAKPMLSSSNVAAAIVGPSKFTVVEHFGKVRIFPTMQRGSLGMLCSMYHQQRLRRLEAYKVACGPIGSPLIGLAPGPSTSDNSLQSFNTGGGKRYGVLYFEQVNKLNILMHEKVFIHGLGGFPILIVTLKDFVSSMRRKLEDDVAAGGAGVIVKDIRLNGGAANYALTVENHPYNDFDLIYALDLTTPGHFELIRTAVLNTLLDMLPANIDKKSTSRFDLSDAYIRKMVKIENNENRWSLITLGNSYDHRSIELKFLDTMHRQFEFSVDSFQIVLDTLLYYYDSSTEIIRKKFYPTVVVESVYGDFREAHYHLAHKLISTRQPEQIRGGGLLKYCNLLVRDYKPADEKQIAKLERYMCSRFFIDFPDMRTQLMKMEAYLHNHFWGFTEQQLQYEYLLKIRRVIDKSTVCLMAYERREILLQITKLANRVLQKRQPSRAQKRRAQNRDMQKNPLPPEMLPFHPPLLNQQWPRNALATVHPVVNALLPGGRNKELYFFVPVMIEPVFGCCVPNICTDLHPSAERSGFNPTAATATATTAPATTTASTTRTTTTTDTTTTSTKSV